MEKEKSKAVDSGSADQPTEETVEETKTEELEIKEQSTSFAALHATRQTQDALHEVQELTHDFRNLAENIIYGFEEDKGAALRALADEYIGLVEEALGDIVETEPVAESVELGESSVGAVISIRESEDLIEGLAPLQLDVVVIEPGWGNKRDNHYYDADMLKENAPVFKGAKMYATDHRSDEKNVRTEVSQVLDCPVGFTETGAPIARVGVFDEAFAASVRNRAALDKLEDLEVSILASGTALPEFEQGGRTGKYIKSISSEGVNVDWVTSAGAGGRALRLAEVEDGMEDQKEDQVTVEDEDEDEGQGKPKVEVEPDVEPEDAADAEPAPEDQVDPEPVEEVKVSESEETPEPTTLTESEVTESLDSSALPDVSRARLAETEYSSSEELAEAIQVEVKYVAKLTGAGRPVGQSAQAATAAKKMTLEDRFVEAEKRHGIYREKAGG